MTLPRFVPTPSRLFARVAHALCLDAAQVELERQVALRHLLRDGAR